MAREKPDYHSHPVVVDALKAPIGTWLSLGLITPPSPTSLPQSPLPAHSAGLRDASADVSQQIETSIVTQAVGTQSIHTQPILTAPSARRSAMTLKRTALCIVSKEFLPQDDLIRFVVSPQGEIFPDLTGKLPGAMTWVKAERELIQKAIWRNSFATALRQTVTIPPNLLELLEHNLSQYALQTLSIAKRAGELSFGFTKSDESLRSGGIGVYVVARDVSENGREKLERLAMHQSIPVLDLWSCAELSAALGADNIHHVTVKKGALAQKLIETGCKLNKICKKITNEDR